MNSTAARKQTTLPKSLQATEFCPKTPLPNELSPCGAILPIP